LKREALEDVLTHFINETHRTRPCRANVAGMLMHLGRVLLFLRRRPLMGSVLSGCVLVNFDSLLQFLLLSPSGVSDSFGPAKRSGGGK
jgi:hypothetical protein